MSQSVALTTTPSAPPVALTIRRLAQELRAGGTAPQLAAALARALGVLPGLGGIEIEPAAQHIPAVFDSTRLTVPLVGTAGLLALMRVGQGAGSEFAPENMQFASAVADLASVVLDQALRTGGDRASADVLSVVLDELPLGILCFDAGGALLFANTAARALLGARLPARWAAVWEQLAAERRIAPGQSFLWQESGRNVLVTARRPTAAGPAAVVLTDLAPRIEAFGETIANIVYRCLVERRRCALAVVQSGDGAPAALELLESARDRWPGGVRPGIVSAELAAIIAPGCETPILWRLLRSLRAGAPAGSLRASVAALQFGSDDPAAFVARAIAGVQPVPDATVPQVLVCDHSPVIAEALEMIFRAEIAVTSVLSLEHGRDALRERSFDGMFLELPLMREDPANEFARAAANQQPGAKLFFTTDLPGPWELADWGLPVAPVFRKPFLVPELRAVVRESLAKER